MLLLKAVLSHEFSIEGKIENAATMKDIGWVNSGRH